MSTGTGRTRPRLVMVASAAAALLGLAACGSSPPGATPASQSGGRQSGGGQAMSARGQAAAANPNLDPGTPMNGVRAPDFRLTNQFGQQISLSAFRGKVVILAFTDSQCTTVCPLTTASMVAAKDLLGRAGDQVQLLGIDANPAATTRASVLAYSRSHGMVNQWDFLTGSLPQLHAAWKAYHVYAQIQKGSVDHTPALYVIDTRSRERRLYLTTMAYAGIGQAGQILAQEASALLPGHPKLASQRSLSYQKGISPRARVRVPAAASGSVPAGSAPPGSAPPGSAPPGSAPPGSVAPGSAPPGSAPPGSVMLGPGRPRLVFFFATWLSETSSLADRLTKLNAYVRAARRDRLPGLVALDEAVTEPSTGTAWSYLAHLGQPLSYPVGLDTTGRIADGYGVQDQPWFVLISASGKLLWKHDGWLPVSALEAAARRAAL